MIKILLFFVFAQASLFAVTIVLPEEWRVPIRRHAAHYGVPVPLVEKLVAHESQGSAVPTRNPNGTYDYYPMGLNTYTIMDIRRYDPLFNPLDPDQNIRYGVAILAERRKKYGNWFDALASWHMGITGYSKVIKGARNLPGGTVELLRAVLGKGVFP